MIAAPQVATGQRSPSRSSTSRPATAKPAAGQKASPEPMTDEQKTIYAVGLSIYQSLAPLALSPAELATVQQALTDSAAGKPAVDLKTWGPKIQALAQSRAARVAEQQKAASQAFLDKAAAEPGAVKTASGLIYRELRPGTGA